ncbi:hypothetical protein [Tenacibaculum agarivorans]|uniref:hypothetical protein n=1 Tax=Tenacibaculum agarivorans TaxID=1908389 RepID=UPI00094B8F4E|nr:hypothetical protein [Tenacibaculum agarivorans]
MSYTDIEQHFSNNIPRKPYSELSLDDDTQTSLVSSAKTSYDFDEVSNEIKTSDTIIFNQNKISLVEFKNGNKVKEIEIRLKCSESIISLTNYILEKGVVNSFCFPNQLIQFYLVFNKEKITGTQLMNFSNIQRKLQREYANFYIKLVILNQDQFKKVFKI